MTEFPEHQRVRLRKQVAGAAEGATGTIIHIYNGKSTFYEVELNYHPLGKSGLKLVTVAPTDIEPLLECGDRVFILDDSDLSPHLGKFAVVESVIADTVWVLHDSGNKRPYFPRELGVVDPRSTVAGHLAG